MQYKYVLIMFFFAFNTFAQNGGKSVFLFSNIEHSPRAQSLGGGAIAIYDNDVSLSSNVPSLLNHKMNNQIAFTYGNYFSDINLISFAFSKEFKKIGFIGFSLKSINYGEFERFSNDGNYEGSFSANDQIITCGIGRKINENLSLGLNFNFLNSSYESYSAQALTSNISASYINKDKKFNATFIIKNLGRQINNYSSNNEIINHEIQFGVSKELKYLPFKYHLTYTNINTFDISSPFKLGYQTNIQTGQLEINEETIAKTFLRHIIIGGELNPYKKSLFIRGGFNFQRRFDMTDVYMPSAVGFSFGIGFRLYRYYFDYSRSFYHLSAINNNFSITTNLSNFGF
tara:strand:- start:2069 stop:3097 length:1029 start_codon:yes stop_codon:yes gene_type:complete